MKTIFRLNPIGTVHSKLKTRNDATSSKIDENIGEIEIYKKYENGLTDIEGFSHIVVIFWMHQSSFKSLRVRPIHFPNEIHGVFATKHPDRPNPLGLTVVELSGRKKNVLRVNGIDMIDGTPVLDIKPYTLSHVKIPTKFGWLSRYQPH
jgi:tRNA-Thr(GGU) m(6)t(6)A37 methyltransferase TsaA